MKVLLIEDDRFLRRACEAGLRKQGFDVLTADDGEEGLRCAREHVPDLILLDMLMPKLSGIETLEILKREERTRGIPVVILSNTSDQSDRDKARDLGAADYLVKASLSLQELGRKITGYLAGGKSADDSGAPS